jgi:hypothetical protein
MTNNPAKYESIQTSDKLHSQSEAGKTNEWINQLEAVGYNVLLIQNKFFEKLQYSFDGG